MPIYRDIDVSTDTFCAFRELTVLCEEECAALSMTMTLKNHPGFPEEVISVLDLKDQKMLTWKREVRRLLLSIERISYRKALKGRYLVSMGV